MSWKEIAVYVKRDSGEEAYLGVAAQLACRFQARLTGVFPLRDLALLRNILDETQDASLFERYVRSAHLAADEFARRFLARMASVKCDWKLAEGDPGQIMVIAGRVADLVIVEHRKPGVDESG